MSEETDRLRLLLGEPIPEGGDEQDTFFTELQVQSLLDNNNDSMNLAAVEGWTMKMARYARLIDMDEAGAARKLSQKYRQAREMSNFFIKLTDNASAVSAATFRAKARVANLDDSDKPCVEGTPFSGYSEHIREYPTKRFLLPAILG